MQKNVLEYLENAVEKFPDRIVYQCLSEKLSFEEVFIAAKKLGTLIAKKINVMQPIVVISEKNIKTIIGYFGTIYAGCYYIPLSNDLPKARIKAILDHVRPAMILIDKKYADLIDDEDSQSQVFYYIEAEETEINETELKARREKQLDNDPLYVLFTSGSSGTPKGVVTSHRSVISYIDAFAYTFNINSGDIFGNQAPLDYVAAIRDIFLPLHTGAKTVMIPKSLFSMPQKLFEFVNEKKITAICWVAAALSLCVELDAFKENTLNTVNKVFFTGSVLPCKHLKKWQENLQNAMFVNHYGPTEITASCSYYIVDHLVAETEVLPIGGSFKNEDMFLLGENNKEVPVGEIGEICIRGAGLALGYYGDFEKTAESFMINPLNKVYPELIYRTGDLGHIDKDGLMYFNGRNDFQIKHMGHRVELGEIESKAASISKIKRCCCLYYEKKEMIWLFYVGEIESKELSIYLREWLPGYMIPRKFMKLNEMPLLSNGKYDINTLKKMMEA